MLKDPRLIPILLLGVALLMLASQQMSEQPIMSSPPPDGERITFFALGDQGSGSYRQHAVEWSLERACQADRTVNFTLLLGDNFYKEGVTSVDDPLWDEYFESMYDGPCLMGMPFYAILGNHDHMKNAQAQVDYYEQGLGTGRWRMPGMSYSQDFGMVDGQTLLQLFVVDITLPIAPQLAEIEAAKGNALWTVVASHHTIRSFDDVYGDNEALLEQMQGLAELGVDLYISGHAHNLQLISVEGEPLYLVSGAGGKRPYELNQHGKVVLVRVDEPYTGKLQLYGNASLGFAKVTVDSEILEISFSPVSLGGEQTFRITRECKEAEEINRCVVRL
tara:strand:- start:756 stop:1754 length:999 start_codon:yes stop_codon:yes gene_type:complete